jgi:hypothetical protein
VEGIGQGLLQDTKIHENMTDLSPGSRYPVRDSSRKPPEYKSEELQLEIGKADGAVTFYICILENLGSNLG